METFQLLSRGGVKFDKNRFKDDVRLFTVPRHLPNIKQKATKRPSKAKELPAELDFFKYARGGAPAKRKADASGHAHDEKRRKVDDEEESDAESSSDPPPPRHRVTAKGSNVPSPADSFGALKERYHLSSHILSNLSSNGFKHPTGIQSHGIPILLEGRDLAAISPTGTGKTLAYVLPLLHALRAPTPGGARAVILAPTKELAHQIHNECLRMAHGRKWRVVLFSKATAASLKDKNARDKVDVIVSTPLRLVAALQSGTLDLNNVRHLVLDEADRMLDAEFLTQVQEIVAACTHPEVQKAVFSATLPAGAEKIAMGMLRDPIRIVVGLKHVFILSLLDTPLPLIAQTLTYVSDESSKLPTLLQYLSQPYNPPVVIFVSSQPRATSLAEELIINSIPNVDCLHAGLTKKEREDAVARMRRGESWVMVSTEVMARGMDFKGVREVINYDFPTSVQSYIHRIGRTGRAGREGKAVTYFTNDDAPFLKSIANVILQSGSTVPEWILKLPKASKMKRKAMGKVQRGEFVDKARTIGRGDAIRKRDMIAGSKRRKEKAERGGRQEKGEGMEDE
ncbi:P-loop containing nucleoside triphosphate hydrolase protein [Heliocybe sulcata]|uniref:RNA helicase n=1 Tax=Heliocybe sulcata TaxID=5364 RepID=A0A5C3NMJ6_9AGAM|nr:P-loop containing nucleoside triphosphate hydrolase protein [Heliocybe sulcata]